MPKRQGTTVEHGWRGQSSTRRSRSTQPRPSSPYARSGNSSKVQQRLSRDARGSYRRDRSKQTHFSREQRNLEEEQARKWVAGEDQFALKQMKRGAMIRVKEGRAKPIDWLAVNLKMIEADPSVYDEEFDEAQEFEMPVPYEIIEDLPLAEIRELLSDIESYSKIDLKQPNADFWQMMRILCLERENKLLPGRGVDHEARVIEPVSQDIDATLKGANYDALVELEDRIHGMLDEKDSAVDVDFWMRLLKEIEIRKAKSKLEEIHKLIISERVKKLKKVQAAEALRAKLQISKMLSKGEQIAAESVPYDPAMDNVPELLPLTSYENAGHKVEQFTQADFFKKLNKNRESVRKLGFVAMKQQDRPAFTTTSYSSKPSMPPLEEQSQDLDPAQSLYDKEMARAVDENEENFFAEESLPDSSSPSHRIKPRYFNRVMLGYDWNKYNKAHFTSENPPPKLVQGYKFNIFYPELANSQKAPSYKIIRDAESKNQEHRDALAAGEADTCIIKFQAPEPYQDIAFRIVDRQWDNSSHRQAGFKSRFENGVLQLHFRFRKVFYRK